MQGSFTQRQWQLWILDRVNGRSLFDHLMLDVKNKFQEANKLHKVSVEIGKVGRKSVNVALETHRRVFLERLYRLYLHTVYEFGIEEHRSATRTLRVAKDHSENGREVAIKFMMNQD